MPRSLAIVNHNGKQYFVDWRLKEFRPVKPPLESIPFDSERGREIDEMPTLRTKRGPQKDKVTVTCSHCGKLLFEGTEKEARGLIIYCEDCDPTE